MGGVLLSMVALLMIRGGVGGEEAAALISNAPSLLIVGAAAAVIIWASLQFPASEPLRKQWLFLGIGTALWSVGGGVWNVYEVVLKQEVPFPGIADVVFLAAIPMLTAGCLLAVGSFNRVLRMMLPVAISLLAGVAAAAFVVLVPLRASLADASYPLFERLVGAAYPVADLVLVLPFALALAFTAARLGGGKIARPWWLVVAGLLAIVYADTMFAVLIAEGTYTAGMYIDAGWWVGFSLIAAGASLAVDVQRPRGA
ncbi:MAG: hypothetical protein FDZ70_07290 [Actinobacteria bacterium]|nr:MAG: hypothetical protein FDZ70_07290 [Actinomycetota bacterium]